MASYRAPAVIAKTIIDLLQAQCPQELSTGALFDLYRPAQYDQPMENGLSLMMYRLAINGSQRNRAPRRAPDGRLMHPSLPVDLHFLLTAWAAGAEMQYLRLGWAMRFLEDRNTLPAGLLNSHAGGSTPFAEDETVELVCDPMPVGDYLQLWDKLKTRIPVSQTYVVRGVLLDSDLEIGEGVAVRTRAALREPS